MMYAVKYVLFVVSFIAFSSCGVEEKECNMVNVHDVAAAPVVVVLSFVDVSERWVMLGPVRVVGGNGDKSFCALSAPFSSQLHEYVSLRPGVSDERRVLMYSAVRGFSQRHPACWRFVVLTEQQAVCDELLLEINYSYNSENAMGSGSVDGMERISLCGFPHEEEFVFSNESLPFSVICVMIPSNRYFNAYYM